MTLRFDKNEARERWVHEDTLINHRLNWLGFSQGLLFTAYGIVFSRDASPEAAIARQDLLSYISGAGFLLSASILVGVLAALIALVLIYRQSDLKHFGISAATTLLGWMTAAAIPLIFCVVWALLFRTGM